jgi:hypothetical protein
MKPEDFFIYLGVVILSLIIFGLIVRWAVRADTIVNNQQAIISHLSKLCRQQGIPDDESTVEK